MKFVHRLGLNVTLISYRKLCVSEGKQQPAVNFKELIKKLEEMRNASHTSYVNTCSISILYAKLYLNNVHAIR